MRAHAFCASLLLLIPGAAPALASDVTADPDWASPSTSPDFSAFLPSTPVLKAMRDAGVLQRDAPAGAPLLASSARSSAPTPASTSVDPPWSANKRIDDDAGTGEENEVSLAADTNSNWYAGWNDNRGGTYKCGYTGSQDGGATWSANELYGGRLDQCGDPVIVHDGSGKLYRLAMPFAVSPSYDGDLDVSSSSDGGKTWGSWVSAVSAGGGLNDKPWLAAQGNYVAVTWTFFGSGEISFIRSLDGGATWGGKLTFGSGQGTCVVIDGNGRTHMGWGTSTVYYQYSDDKGATWSAEKQIGTGGNGGSNPRSTPLPGCGVSNDGKNVYWVWGGTGSGSNEDTWIVYSNDGGANWQPQKKLNDDAGTARQIMPWVAVDAGDKAHVAWTDFRSGTPEAYYTSSSDNGATWIANQRVSDGTGAAYSFMGDYTNIAVAPSGDVGYAWCDSRTSGNKGDIYFSKAKLGAGGGPSIARIDVAPPSANLTADQTQQFAAQAYDTSGNKTNASFTWGASGGSVSASGLYTPGPVGTFDVFANASGKSGKATVTVSPGALASVSVSPPSVTVPAGGSAQFSASGRDAKGNALPVTVSWTSSGGSIDQTGKLTAPTTVGSVTVTATNASSGKSGTATANVVAGPVSKIEVAPPTASITADQTQQFTASGFDQYGNPAPVTPVWSASGGTVSGSGLYTPNKVGSFDVTASANGTSAKATVTVTPGALASIVLSPPGATITADETVKFTAKGYDAKGNDVTISPSWSATPSGTMAQDGTYNPDKVGTVTVKATQGVVSGTATVTVGPGKAAVVKVDPPSRSITADDTATFAASATDAKGNDVSGVAIDWTAEDGAISGTAASGRFTPQKTGTWKITATARGTTAKGEASVAVTPGKIFEARIDPDAATLKVDESVPFTAVGLDAKGNDVGDATVDWKTDSSLGTIDTTGVFKAKRAGSGKVTATVSKTGGGSASATAEVTVTPLDTSESIAKVFGGSTNALIFFIALAAIVVALVALGLWSRRKRRWKQAYAQASGPFSAPGIGMEVTSPGGPGAPPPEQFPSPPPPPGGNPPPYIPPPPGQ